MTVKELKELLAGYDDDFDVVGLEKVSGLDPVYHEVAWTDEHEVIEKTVVLGGDVIDAGHPLYWFEAPDPSDPEDNERNGQKYEQSAEWPYWKESKDEKV